MSENIAFTRAYGLLGVCCDCQIFELEGERVEKQGHIALSDIADWLAMEQVTLTPSDIRAGIDALNQREMVVVDEGAGTAQLSRRPGAAVALSLIRDRLDYLNSAKLA